MPGQWCECKCFKFQSNLLPSLEFGDQNYIEICGHLCPTAIIQIHKSINMCASANSLSCQYQLCPQMSHMQPVNSLEPVMFIICKHQTIIN